MVDFADSLGESRMLLSIPVRNANHAMRVTALRNRGEKSLRQPPLLVAFSTCASDNRIVISIAIARIATLRLDRGIARYNGDTRAKYTRLLKVRTLKCGADKHVLFAIFILPLMTRAILIQLARYSETSLIAFGRSSIRTYELEI